MVPSALAAPSALLVLMASASTVLSALAVLSASSAPSAPSGAVVVAVLVALVGLAVRVALTGSTELVGATEPTVLTELAERLTSDDGGVVAGSRWTASSLCYSSGSVNCNLQGKPHRRGLPTRASHGLERSDENSWADQF